MNSNTQEKLLAQAEQLCQQRNVRLTPQRLEVLRLMAQQPGAISAYDLLDLLRVAEPQAKPPTVYRALDFLIEEGLIHRLDAVNAWSACMDAGGEPHDLLIICTQCGAVAEFSDPDLSRRLAKKVASAGFVLANHETELRALCGKCYQQAQPQHAH